MHHDCSQQPPLKALFLVMHSNNLVRPLLCFHSWRKGLAQAEKNAWPSHSGRSTRSSNCRMVSIPSCCVAPSSNSCLYRAAFACRERGNRRVLFVLELTLSSRAYVRPFLDKSISVGSVELSDLITAVRDSMCCLCHTSYTPGLAPTLAAHCTAGNWLRPHGP